MIRQASAVWCLSARWSSAPGLWCIYIYIYIYTYTYTIYIYIYTYVLLYVCTCICTCICTCKYIYIYIAIQIDREREREMCVYRSPARCTCCPRASSWPPSHMLCYVSVCYVIAIVYDVLQYVYIYIYIYIYIL